MIYLKGQINKSINIEEEYKRKKKTNLLKKTFGFVKTKVFWQLQY